MRVVYFHAMLAKFLVAMKSSLVEDHDYHAMAAGLILLGSKTIAPLCPEQGDWEKFVNLWAEMGYISFVEFKKAKERGDL
jgi:hypothetical protein